MVGCFGCGVCFLLHASVVKTGFGQSVLSWEKTTQVRERESIERGLYSVGSISIYLFARLFVCLFVCFWLDGRLVCRLVVFGCSVCFVLHASLVETEFGKSVLSWERERVDMRYIQWVRSRYNLFVRSFGSKIGWQIGMWVDWLGRFQGDACCLYLSFYTENRLTVMEQMFWRTRFSDKGLIDHLFSFSFVVFSFPAFGACAFADVIYCCRWWCCHCCFTFFILESIEIHSIASHLAFSIYGTGFRAEYRKGIVVFYCSWCWWWWRSRWCVRLLECEPVSLYVCLSVFACASKCVCVCVCVCVRACVRARA